LYYSKSRNSIALILGICLLGASLTALAGGKVSVRGKNGIVASTSRFASEAGIQVLKDGGNAVDAAVAVAFTLAVTWPSGGNIGGGGFLVYYGADGFATTFDFREKAPLAASENMFLDDNGAISDQSNHLGILAVGVPGTVAGLELAHKRLGTLPWKDLLVPAVRIARDGMPLSWHLHDAFKNRKERWEKYPSSARVFLKSDGSFYEPDDNWAQPDLAATLERIQFDGKDGFYAGETASLITDFMAKNGGIITLEDLDLYEAVEREPIRGTYRGYEIVSMPAPSSGGTILVEMLNILEGFDLRKMGHNSAQYMHLLTETMRRAYADRAEYLGDSDFNEDLPVERLTSKSHAAKLRDSIDLKHASVSDPAKFTLAYESDQTTHFSVVDRFGNMVSLTYTLEWAYGSGIVVEGAGFLLNNEMGDFNAQPGITDAKGRIGTRANLIEPQKRMLSSMTPTILAKDGVPIMATGSPGGRTIINTSLQTILNVIDHEMTVAQAVEAGRLHHQWLPDRTDIEKHSFSADSMRLFENMGHDIREVDAIGQAMIVYHDVESQLYHGAADSRAPDGAAVTY